MNVQQIIVRSTVSCHKSGDYHSVQLIEVYCESSIGGGKMHEQITWYDDLTKEEAVDVLEAIASGPLAGDLLVVRQSQLSLL